MGNEKCGFDFLLALHGRSAARVYGVCDNAACIEWLSGPSLGDLTRQGNDATATKELLEVANGVHSRLIELAEGVPTVAEWLQDLFGIQKSALITDQDFSLLIRCRALAKELLGTPEPQRVLHGDLHHDNIKRGDRGFCAFDAKGVVGELGYELANAFRNPEGATEIIFDPDRIRFLRDLWSTGFGVPAKRLMQWACVKTALSIVWRSEGILQPDPEYKLLELFLQISEQTE